MPAPSHPLAEKEFLLIREISRRPTSTQRDLSKNLGLSLGMTNLLIRRLARKGIIKITQLDWKRTQYLLTLKGAMEKTRKTYHYTLYTWRIFRQIQENIRTALSREHAAGRKNFVLVAQDELLDLLRETVSDLALPGARFSFLSRFEETPPNADLVLTATLQAPPKSNGRQYLSLVDFDQIDFRLS
ncbi:MAG: winged helix-turn-helix transcriptional regulator [Elusimicrobia bacterium]|nr:winged helix-turn-helix transcriptional regulator [Elusimicrobiota bacterium]